MLHCSYSLYSSCYNNKQHAFHCFLHGTTLLSYTMYPSIWRPPSPRSAGGVGAAAASGCRATARRRRRHYSDEDEAHGRQQDQAPLLSRVSEWPRKPKESLWSNLLQRAVHFPLASATLSSSRFEFQVMYSNLTGATLATLIKNGLVFGGFHQPLSCI